MLNAEDFDGDYEMAYAVNREVMERTNGQASCYCTSNSICKPCQSTY